MSWSLLAPEKVSYSAVTSAREKGSQWEAALRLLQGMSRSSLATEKVNHKAIASACDKGSRWEAATRLLQEI